MFQNISELKVRTIWKKSKFNVAEAIDNLLLEDSNGLPSSENENDVEVDEDSLSKSPTSSKTIEKKRKLQDSAGKG
jgi:hypothetical protein